MAYCDSCDRWFSSNHALRQHLQNSTSHNHVCNVCYKRFYSKQSLDQHCGALSHYTESVSCHLCGKFFASEAAKEQHLASPKHTVSCVYCLERFGNKTLLMVHYKTAHAYCDFCLERFESNSLLMVHYKTAHAYCNDCSQPFKDFPALEEHVRNSPVHDPPMEPPEPVIERKKKPSKSDDELANEGLRKLLQDKQMLEHLKSGNGAALIPLQLMAQIRRFLKDLNVRAIMEKVWAWIRAHPYQTFFILLGIFIMLNPLAMVGFGALGPIAGSIAAGIQAGHGGVIVAGSAFAVCQSLGMTIGAGVFFPVVGSAIAASAIASVPLYYKAKAWWDKWWGSRHDEDSDDDDEDDSEDSKAGALVRGRNRSSY